MSFRNAASVLLISSALVACSSDDAAPTKTDTYDDVVYASGTNDESLEAMVGAPVQKDRSTIIESPAAGAQVTFPATFTWSLGGPVTLRSIPNLPSKRARGFDFLSILERTAHAHGTPVSGTAFFVSVTKGGTPVFRLFTKETTFDPDAKQWALMTAAGPGLTISVTAAVFDEGRVVNGPYAGSGITFDAK